MKSYPNVTAVLLCAGKGSRANLGYNKILHPDGGVPVAVRSMKKLAAFTLIVVCSDEDEIALRERTKDINAIFVRGGQTRSDSVRAALKAVPPTTEIVLIHDGARPFVTNEIIFDSIEKAYTFGSGVAAYQSTNALKMQGDEGVYSLDRSKVFVVQTPQSFRLDLLKKAYDDVPGSFPDDSEIFEKAGNSVTLSLGSPDNVKLTTPSDFMGLGGSYKIGYGFDVHPFKEGRRLVLCGEQYDLPYGLFGHSDADAPVHAVMDAILTATGLPDIGVLFPDTDEKYRGADSMKLLEEVVRKASEFEVVNLTVCIMAQKPKISPRSAAMRKNLAAALGISEKCVDISATTTEFLGIIGEGKGLAASATVLMKKR